MTQIVHFCEIGERYNVENWNYFLRKRFNKRALSRNSEEERIILMNNELLNDQNPLVTFSISCHKYSVAFSLLNLRGALFVKLLDISSKLCIDTTNIFVDAFKKVNTKLDTKLNSKHGFSMSSICYLRYRRNVPYKVSSSFWAKVFSNVFLIFIL